MFFSNFSQVKTECFYDEVKKLGIPFHLWHNFINEKLNMQYEVRKKEEKIDVIKLDPIEEEKDKKKHKKEKPTKKKSIFGIFPF